MRVIIDCIMDDAPGVVLSIPDNTQCSTTIIDPFGRRQTFDDNSIGQGSPNSDECDVPVNFAERDEQDQKEFDARAQCVIQMQETLNQVTDNAFKPAIQALLNEEVKQLALRQQTLAPREY